MPRAFYFDDPLDLCDFVKASGSGLVSEEPYELVRIEHPKRPGRVALLLFNADFADLNWRKRSYPLLVASKDDQSVNWLPQRRKREVEAAIVRTDQARSLLEFVELMPWKEGNKHELHLIFWLKNPDLLPELVRDSLRLGNDRIQYAQLEEKADGSPCLLRIEHPSYFLTQRCLEDHPDEVELFYPVEEDLYLQWGYEHPLGDLWDQSEKIRNLGWVFFRHDAEREHLEPVRWQDAYDLAEFELDFPHEELRAQSSSSPPRFKVPLRLHASTHRRAEAELWLLDESGLSQLEALLHLIDEDQIRPYQLAVQCPEDGGEEASDLVFVRERRAGAARKHLEFGGMGFATFQGLNNFFLPVGRDLFPPLRRDLYRHLFGLQPDSVTVVVPDDGEEGKFRIVRIHERGFQSLPSFLDYIVERDAEVLKDRLEESLFDFSDYLKSPSHVLARPKDSEKDSGSRDQAIALEEELGEGSGSDEEESSRISIEDYLRESGDEIDESQLEELQLKELQLEREVISGQSLDRWTELALCKDRLGKREEALVCALEGIWMSPTRKAVVSLHQLLREQLDQQAHLVLEIETMTGSEPETTRRATLMAHLETHPGHTATSTELDQWVAETTAFLQRHESGYRMKERWLAWSAVLETNQDERRETQVRDSIRDRITDSGLGLEEVPAFIRNRIFLDRNRSNQDREAATGETGIESALANIQAVETLGSQFKNPLLRATTLALVARAFCQVGNLPGALKIIDNYRPMDSDLEIWCVMFHAQALEAEIPERGEELNARVDERLPESEEEVRNGVEELRELHRFRSDIDNPAAFLAQENRNRSYPSGGFQSMGVLYELSCELEKSLGEGDEPRTVMIIRSMLNLENTEDYDDYVKLPQFIESMVDGISRFKWGDRGAALLPAFENFANRVPDFLTKHVPFYLSLLHTNLANGLIVTENLERANQEVERAIRSLNSGQTELDFIDGAAAVVGVVEQLPLEQRARHLSHLLKMFVDLFDEDGSHYLKRGRLFAVLARLLEQFAEAAISKDRISLNQFKNYQLQDEFLILQRIQRDSFSK